MWELNANQPPFEEVEGEFRGRVFTHGRSYKEIPPGRANRFQRTAPATVTEPALPAAPATLTDDEVNPDA